MENFREELRYEYPELTPESVLLDIGGHNGDWAAKMYDKYGCRVLVFEPVPEYYDKCVMRFQGNCSIELFPFAVGRSTDRVSLGIKGDMSGAFCSDPNDTVLAKGGDIAWICEAHLGDKNYGCIKINCEGSEFDILERLTETGQIKCMDNVQVQWHDVAPNAQARYEALQAKLALTHELSFDHGWVWQSWRLK